MDEKIEKTKRQIERASKFFEVSKNIVEVSANQADAVAYVARVLAQVTLPHSPQKSNEYERTNGSVTIRAVSLNSKVGLPFGTYPRLLLAWMGTEAVRTKSPVLELGDNLSSFMRELNLVPTGGRWGSVTRLRDQMNRLTATAISWTAHLPNGKVLNNVVPVREAKLWWDPKQPTQSELWRSSIRLDQEFYEALVASPVPLDMRALKVLAHERSPLALDIYTWLTYRMSYLEEATVVPWASLEAQFGGNFTRPRAFKEKFLERLKLVQQLYPAARVRPSSNKRKPGLLIEPSPTHVPKRLRA